MGDIADMMLEGLLDEETGEYIGDENMDRYGVEAPGFPVSYERESREQEKFPSSEKKHCPICNKKVRPTGLQQHIEAKHGHVEAIRYEFDGGCVTVTDKKWSFFRATMRQDDE